MELKLLHILTYLSLALVASYAALPPASSGQTYWNTKLPNTPMPKAIKDSLQPTGLTEDKRTSVEVGKGGVNVNTGKGHSGSGTNVNVGHKGVGVNTGKGHSGRGGTNVNVGHKGVGVSTGGGTHVGVGKGGVGVTTPGHHGKPPVYVGVRPGPSPFVYNYAAKDDQLHDNPNVALFFLEKDLHQGSNMNLQFVKTTNHAATFLPRQVANSIPFSSNKMPEIINQLSVKPDSEEARILKQTVQECEEPGIKGEEKYCATSLESMVDFSTSKLGNEVQPVSTETEKETQMQKYTILGAKKMGNGKSDAVVCHKQNYAYAVFYCHKTETTESYMVSLVGADGTKAKAVAVCHKDTSAWNPKHLAFKVLKVTPGSVPVCHFLPEDHIVWVPKN
ncbi:PREDICTED: BURP domain protein RD22 [Nicotiana attenuata]|uniref:Burp domain protein rd22 n=1 Tax=Nicotiana attenuata TaxID=49451 RepID=A0A314L282_NICAT|nr:PREDICTED: BURP domain protein RD22 [Nicotiana attenuata]OIT35748.1 burp domain protein rd22 [Nicotiana attenuata]